MISSDKKGVCDGQYHHSMVDLFARSLSNHLFLAHGTSAAMIFKIRNETELERIRAMLDLSDSTLEIMFISFLSMGLTGLVLPFFIRIWNKGWVWLSIVLMLFVFIWMVWMNERTYKILRKLVGLPYRQGSKEYSAEPPAELKVIVSHLKNIHVMPILLIGYGIPTFVLWLMVFKPF